MHEPRLGLHTKGLWEKKNQQKPKGAKWHGVGMMSTYCVMGISVNILHSSVTRSSAHSLPFPIMQTTPIGTPKTLSPTPKTSAKPLENTSHKSLLQHQNLVLRTPKSPERYTAPLPENPSRSGPKLPQSFFWPPNSDDPIQLFPKLLTPRCCSYLLGLACMACALVQTSKPTAGSGLHIDSSDISVGLRSPGVRVRKAGG